MKKVILTLVVGLFFITFSNAQSKAVESEAMGKEEVREVKKEVKEAYTVKGNAMSIAAKPSCAGKAKPSCAGKSKKECATKKKECATKGKKECATKSKKACCPSKSKKAKDARENLK